MKKFGFIILSLLMMTACATDNKINTKEQLLDKLKQTVADGIILYGHHDDTLYGHTWKGERGRSDVKDVCGAYPFILSVDLGHIELANKESLDHVRFDEMHDAIVDHYKRGGIVTISWHLDNPVTGGNSWDVSCDTVVRSILPGQANNALFSQWLDRAADFMLSLRNDEGKLIPVIFRPWHEHTGHWFWWGQPHCTTDEYVALWEMTRRHMTERGLDNLVYAYSPNLGVDKTGYMERYPGDEVIDLLGMDIYQFDKRDSLDNIVDNGAERYMTETKKALSFLTELGKEHNKPIAFTETGLEGLSMPTWWTEVLLPTISSYPIAYVLTWRNASDNPKHFYAPFPGQASADDFVKFYQAKNTGFIPVK